MERLLADADAINAKQGVITQYSLSNLSDVYEAIHVVQTEMGIAGATALEATTTIEGGIKLIKAKLGDLVTQIGGAFAPAVQAVIGMIIDGLPAIEAAVDKLVPRIEHFSTVLLPSFIAMITNCCAWISENSDKIVEWTGYIVAAGVGVGTFLVYLNWGQIMATAGAALDVVTMSIKKMNTAIKSNPIGLVISLIASLIAYLGYLYATNEEFRAFVDEMLSVLWAKLQVVFAWIQANVLPIIQQIIEWAKANVIPVIQKIVEWISDSLVPAIGKIIEWVRDHLLPVVIDVISWISEKVGSFFSWFIGIFQSTSDSTGGIWEKIKGFFSSAWDFIVGVWEACQPFFQGVWDGVILPVADLVGEIIGAFKMAWDVIVLVWDKCAPYFAAAWEAIKLIWDLVAPYFKVIWEQIKGIFSVVATYLGGFFKTAWEAIKAIWNVVIDYFTMVWAGIKAVFAVVKGVLSGDFSDAWEAIKNLWNRAKEFFSSVWTGIKNVFSSTGSWFGNTFKAAWEAVKNVFSAWGSFFGGLWTTIKDKFSAIGTNIANAISSSVKKGLNGVISSIESIINSGVNMINGAINLINKIPGVSIGKLSKLSLPRLERGGVLEKGQVGLLEGNGAEAVVPLHQNEKWIRAVAEDMESAIGGTSNNQENIEQFIITIISLLEKLLGATEAGHTIALNKREFARLVKEVG